MAALENNTLGMSNSEDQAVTENQVDNSLDLSTADSPIDPLNDYNLDNIQAQSDTAQQLAPTTQDPPTKKKVLNTQELQALSQKQKKRNKGASSIF